MSIGVYYYSAKFLSSSTIILNKSVNIKFVNKIKNTILVIGSIIAVTGIAGSLYAIYYPDVYLDRTRVYSGYARTTGGADQTRLLCIAGIRVNFIYRCLVAYTKTKVRASNK